MKHTTKYVGLDVHQATTLAMVREGSGKIIARTILPTEEAALPACFPPLLLRLLPAPGAKHRTAQWKYGGLTSGLPLPGKPRHLGC